MQKERGDAGYGAANQKKTPIQWEGDLTKGEVDQRERLLEVRNDFLNSFSSLSSCVAFAFNRIGVYSIVKLHFHLYIEDGHGRVDAGHEGEA